MADSPTFNSCAFVISTQPYLQTTPMQWLALPGHHNYHCSYDVELLGKTPLQSKLLFNRQYKFMPSGVLVFRTDHCYRV
jgi:hypothetical protein